MADPRLPLSRGNLTANEFLQDRAIRHSTFVNRLSTSEVNRILKLLDEEVFPDLADKITVRLARIKSRGQETTAFTTRRYKEMLAFIDAEIDSAIQTLTARTASRVDEVAKMEVKWQRGTLSEATRGLNIEYRAPSNSLLRSAVRSRPFQGRTLRTWTRDLGINTKRNIHGQINIGLVEGESTDQIVRRLRNGVFPTTRRHASTIVRTAVSHTTSRARELTYAENSDVIKGVQWISTLDINTSDICIDLDGQVFEVGRGTRPPAHPNERSTTAPVLKSWKELGINLREAPEGTRASMNGQVPEKLTYKRWLARQPASHGYGCWPHP